MNKYYPYKSDKPNKKYYWIEFLINHSESKNRNNYTNNDRIVYCTQYPIVHKLSMGLIRMVAGKLEGTSYHYPQYPHQATMKN